MPSQDARGNLQGQRQPQHWPPHSPATAGFLFRGCRLTTIAFAAGILAADSYASDDACVMEVVKCAALPNGDVAGGAGDLGQVTQALDWLKSDRKTAAPEIDSASILYTEGGVLFIASCRWPGARCRSHAAIGSGSQGALVAMRMGLSADEAVRAVAGVDPCTGGHIEVLTVALRPKAKIRGRAKA